MVGCALKAGSKAHFDAINHTGLIKSLRKRLEEPSTLSLDVAKAWWQEICARLHPFHRSNWQETIIDPMIQAWAGDAWRAKLRPTKSFLSSSLIVPDASGRDLAPGVHDHIEAFKSP